MFPYPSGAGLHVGHPEGYTATDILSPLQAHARLQRAAPDGLGRVRPARRAVRRSSTGEHPAHHHQQATSTTSAARSRRSASATTGTARSTPPIPDYYKWTQWIFCSCTSAGLAYAPRCRQLVPGARHRARERRGRRRQVRRDAAIPSSGGSMRQWMLRITAYADRLLEDLDGLDWPERHARRAARLDRQVRRRRRRVRARGPATRPSRCSPRGPTRCSARTYMRARARARRWSIRSRPPSSAPPSRRIREDVGKQLRARTRPKPRSAEDRRVHRRVRDQPGQRQADPDLDRRLRARSYGTGAMMAVPAHDERDHAFAAKFGLPIIEVRRGAGEHDVQEAGVHRRRPARSTRRSSTASTDAEAKTKIIAWLEEHGLGEKQGATTAARLAVLAASATGASRSPCCIRQGRHRMPRR